MSGHDEVTLIDVPGYAGPERRMEMAEWRQQVDLRLGKGSDIMGALAVGLKENTELTQKVQTDTAELVELLRSFKGAFQVFNMVGRAARPLGYIAMAGSAIYGLFAAIKGGGVPPK